MFIILPTYTELENLKAALTFVLVAGVGLWVLDYVVNLLLDIIVGGCSAAWHAVRGRRAARLQAISEKQAERRRFQAVMPAREDSMTITYTLNLTVTRPVRLYDNDSLQETATWMETPAAKRELEKEVLQALRKIDGDCDVEVMETERSTDEDDEDNEPCLPDGTPLFPKRKLTRNEKLQGLADNGCDTLEEYEAER